VFKRLSLVAFGITIALVMVEVGLRQLGPLVDPAAKNQWLGCVGWAGQPHQQEYYHTDEFSSVEIINSAGLPDVEHTYEKPDGVFRILIIGDSFVESYQVNLEKSFPRLLEARLNENRSAQDPRFEVIKAGYRAWGTDQEWLYFKCEGYKYEPDLVLLGFTINDVPDNYLPLKARMAQWSESAPPKPYYTWEEGQLKQYNFPFPPPPAEVQPQTLYDYLYKYSLSYRVAEKGWQSLKLKIAELSQPPAALEVEPGESRYPRWTIQFSMPLYMAPLPAEHEAAWQLTEALLRAFHQEVVVKGFKFAVYSNSSMWTVHPSIQEILISEEPLYTSAKFDWEQPDRRLGENLQTMGVPYLRLDPPFREQSAANNEQLLFFREGHWNEAGHQLAAELIYHWLIEQKLVP
jgi:hypothetical protein